MKEREGAAETNQCMSSLPVCPSFHGTDLPHEVQMVCSSKHGHLLLPKTYFGCLCAILKLFFCVFEEFTPNKKLFLSSLTFLFLIIFLDRKKMTICLIRCYVFDGEKKTTSNENLSNYLRPPT